MVANAIHFPAALQFRQLTFHPDVPSRSGGQSTTGYEQVTFSGAGRWRASGSIYARGEEQVLAHRALLAQLQGRAGTILVPAPLGYRPRNVNGRAVGPCPTASYSGGLLNFDLSGWGQDETVYATVETPAAIGATQISITLVEGEGPRPGHYFGLGDRLYLASHVWRDEVGDPTQVRFWPPLRAGAALDDTVILDRPVCLMRLAEDASGEMPLDAGRFGEATLSFVEAL